MRRSALVIAATLALVGPAVPASAAQAATCPVYSWGSTADVDPDTGRHPVADVRTGRHTCYDRVVFDIAGGAPHGWRVEYVDQVRQDGSGNVINVPGAAKLQVVLNHGVHDHDDNDRLAFTKPIGPVANVSGYSTLRSVVYAGSFEGQTTFGIGTRARLPHRVYVLNGPDAASRIVVEVAHRWTAW